MFPNVYVLRIFIVAAKDADGKLRGSRKKIRIEGAVEKGTKGTSVRYIRGDIAAD